MWYNCTETVRGVVPIAREGHGFAQAPSGNIYLFGGNSSNGKDVRGQNESQVNFMEQQFVSLYLRLHLCHVVQLIAKHLWPSAEVTRDLFLRAKCFGYHLRHFLYLLAGLLNDFYSFEPAKMTWNLVVVNKSQSMPSSRWLHGFSEANGNLFVFGGLGNEGTSSKSALHTCYFRLRWQLKFKHFENHYT